MHLMSEQKRLPASSFWLSVACCMAILLPLTSVTFGNDESTKVIDPIVGKWNWFTAETVTFHPDGTFTTNSGTKGKWVVVGYGANRKYTVNWGRYIDSLRMTKYDKELTGKNQNGAKVTAVRVEQK
jgi:hypothetical protein